MNQSKIIGNSGQEMAIYQQQQASKKEVEKEKAKIKKEVKKTCDKVQKQWEQMPNDSKIKLFH